MRDIASYFQFIISFLFNPHCNCYVHMIDCWSGDLDMRGLNDKWRSTLYTIKLQSIALHITLHDRALNLRRYSEGDLVIKSENARVYSNILQ